MKTETWNGHEIRFVWHEGEWWAVAKDVAIALAYRDAHNMARVIDERQRGTHKVSTPSDKPKCTKTQDMLVVSELGVYEAIFSSRRPEAEDFQRWVYEMLKALRQQTGLEGFQVFRMLDREHQKQAMAELHRSLQRPARVDFIKANTIANKAVSSKHGYGKMVKKGDMSPEMLIDR